MDCRVCEAIVEVCEADFDEWDDEILGEVSEVLSTDCPHAQSLLDAVTLEKPLADFPGHLLAIKKEEKETCIRFGLAEEAPDGEILFNNVSTHALELAFRNQVPNHCGRAIIPDAQWIDLTTVASWISTCVAEHPGDCGDPSWLRGSRIPNPEWLIDVVDVCIVASPAQTVDYVALSYTWGLGRNLKNTKAILEDLQRPGALNMDRFAAQIPETIRHAIALVAALGKRYLWVDALCIVQDDPKSLDKNLNQMHLLYAGAFFCVVAAAGHGAEYGLRGLKGVSPARSIETSVYQLANGEMLVAEPPALQQSPSYFQRGWTFQEWAFSRRRLVFRQHLLEWQCQCANWKECLAMNPQADARWKLSRRGTEFLKLSPNIWSFMEMAPMFNWRAFSFQEDAPRAFAGIQAMLHRVQPGGIIYGLSEFFFEISLAWSSLYSSIDRRDMSASSNTDRKGLPSWSWLGWKGDISFPYDAEFQLTQPWHSNEPKNGFLQPVTEWFVMASRTSTSKRRIRSRWYEYKSSFSQLTRATQLPSGWEAEFFCKEQFPYEFSMPGREPAEIFHHEIDRLQKFKYPVPVLNWADEQILSEQAEFLCCTTTRVCLQLTENTSIMRVDGYERQICVLDEGRRIVLSLTLPNTQQVAKFFTKNARPKDLELIAFAKGWSTWLGFDQADEPASKDEPMSGVMNVRGRAPTGCYFVFWVERVDDVYYRLASGEACENWWEQNVDKQPLQVILN